MKRAKKKAKPRRVGGPVQLFDLGPWRFHVTRALALANNRAKYRLETRPPAPEWVGPSIDIDFRHVDHADLRQPVLFATVVQDGRPWKLLIDGHHRVVRALREQAVISLLTLDLADTLKVLSGPPGTVEQMRRDGQRLGLLPTTETE